MSLPLNIALPKGRLLEKLEKHLSAAGIHLDFADRRLVADDTDANVRGFLVKNSDLPTYVHHGIAGLGVCGEDVLYESGYDFVRLLRLPYGGTRMCLACDADRAKSLLGDRSSTPTSIDELDTELLLDSTNGGIEVATKFVQFSRDYFHERGIPVEVVRLNGSVELAPVLGLTPYIVDLVETGSTLRANNLAVICTLATIEVSLIANPAYFKLHHHRIESIIEVLKRQIEKEHPERE